MRVKIKDKRKKNKIKKRGSLNKGLVFYIH